MESVTFKTSNGETHTVKVNGALLLALERHGLNIYAGDKITNTAIIGAVASLLGTDGQILASKMSIKAMANLAKDILQAVASAAEETEGEPQG